MMTARYSNRWKLSALVNRRWYCPSRFY